MSKLRFERLAAIKTPLVNKFYTAHNARGRANKQDQVWVAYHEHEIIAACRIQHRQRYLFLSTLLVAPLWRRQQVAQQLLQVILSEQQQVIYTFSYRKVVALYSELGFIITTDLPEVFEVLYNSYKNRNIIPMSYHPITLSTASPDYK
ncbi:MAG: GNAT family N-acetyltransferase [Pseudoalteromonas sp.]